MPNTDDPNEPTVDLSQEAPKTTPVLEQILEGVNALREEVAGLREEQKATSTEIRELKKTVHSLERRFDIFNQDLLRIRADILDHENRIEEIERKAS